jgi:hypothetical protein
VLFVQCFLEIVLDRLEFEPPEPEAQEADGPGQAPGPSMVTIAEIVKVDRKVQTNLGVLRWMWWIMASAFMVRLLWVFRPKSKIAWSRP